ncbi:hypothetical protein Droror1_Dr00022695 [Drosera rotundifolia]
MEKVCEFCTVLQPVIYCTADAAFLCLSCDAKVHSANAVSNRHFRTLLCEVCRNQPSYVRCLEHQMVMCHSCERTLHEVVSHQHGTRSISSYAGCPSANHFAKLWGFDVNELNTVPVVDHMSCNSCISEDSCAVTVNRMGITSSVTSRLPLAAPSAASVISSESFASSSSRRRKAPMKKQLQNKTSMIMQQILELRRLQVTEGSTSSIIRREGKLDKDSSLHNMPGNHEEFPDQCSDDLPGPVIDLDKTDSPDQGLSYDPFWQCRSPCGNSQFWSQNLQEIGICEEFDGFEDLKMPCMDGSFCDFEDLFGADDQDVNSALLDDIDGSWSSIEKEATADVSVNSYCREREIHKPIAVGKHAHPSDKGHLSSSRSVDSLLHIQHSSSASFSLSAENISNHCLDFSHSGINMGDKPSYACIDVKSKASVLKRCKGRRTARPHKRQVQLALHKGKAETDERGKGD